MLIPHGSPNSASAAAREVMHSPIVGILDAQNNVIDGLMAENNVMREALEGLIGPHWRDLWEAEAQHG